MNKKVKRLYYEPRCGFQIIGCLLKKHDLLDDLKYNIRHTDFYEEFHKGIFTAIYNLLQDGIEEITPIEIEGYLNRISPRFYKIVFEDNDGFDWMEESIKHASLANFNHNYDRLKKMSLLRDMIDNGFSVRDILDKEEIDNKEIEIQNGAFDKMTLNDLISTYELKIMTIKGNYESNSQGDYKRAGDKSEETIARIKSGENYGLMGLSGFKNRVTYGNRRKKFHLMSAGTGGGKSRLALGELGFSIAIELWDYKTKSFIINPNNPNGELSGIYVGTELELDNEVDVILWAVVSGIETSKIIEWDLTEDEEKRLYYAIEIIKKSKIHLYDRPNYDIKLLENIVKKHQVSEDVYMLGIDYILLTTNLVVEAHQYSGGMWTREDQLFLFISKQFKETLANGLNIYVSSSTQLNRSLNDKTAEKNEGMIRGSFALCDKVDVGSLVLKIDKQELEFVSEILKKGWNTTTPTHVEHIFKNRGGKHAQIRIFRTTNLGNMQLEDLFCTNWDYELLDINQVFAEPIVDNGLNELKEVLF